MAAYYDLILGLIPVALFGIAGVLTVAGVSVTTAVPVAALVSAGLIGHALFVRAPIAEPPVQHDAGTPAQSSGFGSAD